MSCPACNGDRSETLGILGNLKHFRCCYCGMTYSQQLPPRRAPELRTKEQTLALLAAWGRSDLPPKSGDLFIEFPDTDDHQDAAVRIRKSARKSTDYGKPMWEIEFIPRSQT